MNSLGIIVLDKPSGVASNKAMSHLKRQFGIRKMGFLGTLDPLATGVLPVFVGKATKLIPAFEGSDKTYRVEIRLGVTTDTFDAEGKVLERRPINGLTKEAVQRVVKGFAGTMQQTAPAFSAIKHGGIPAYKLARAGKEVPERHRTVHLHDLEIESIALPHVTFQVTCSSGTYMRSLAADIGEALAVGAHVTALRRVRCGPCFELAHSWTLDRIDEAIAAGDSAFLHNPASFLSDYWPFAVDGADIPALRQGRTIALPGQPSAPGDADKVKAMSSDGELLAIGKATPGLQGIWGFQPSRVLV